MKITIQLWLFWIILKIPVFLRNALSVIKEQDIYFFTETRSIMVEHGYGAATAVTVFMHLD